MTTRTARGVQYINLLYLLNPGRLGSVGVVEEEETNPQENVHDRGGEGKVRDQSYQVLHTWSSLGHEVEAEEGELEAEREKHYDQVRHCEELVPAAEQSLVRQVVGVDV